MQLSINRSPRSHSQLGLSLVELMIGIAIGMIVVAGASLLMSNQVSEHGKLMQETQIQQDLRATADLMLRDLRRSGYWENSDKAVWSANAAASPNPYSAASAPDTQAVRYAYSTVTTQRPENDQLDATDSYGFKLDSDGTLRSLLGGNWQALTDPAVLEVTSFSITPVQQAIDLSAYCDQVCDPATQNCPRMQVILFDISITGRSVRDPNVVRTISVASRPRNDEITGACPVPP